MKSLLEKEFGFKVDHVKELNGYDNKNYKVTQGQNQYVFKTYKAEEELFQIVNGENLTLSHLKETMGDRIPVIVHVVWSEPEHNISGEFRAWC